MGRRSEKLGLRSAILVTLPPDVMMAFDQFRTANFPDGSMSGAARELIISALSKNIEVGTLDAVRRAEAQRTREWILMRFQMFLREIAQDVGDSISAMHAAADRAPSLPPQPTPNGHDPPAT